MEKEERIIIFECNCNYNLEDSTGSIYEKGDALIQIDKENLSLLPKFSEPFNIHLRDIIDITPVE